MNIFIAGITSDIGTFIAKKYIEKGHVVHGTYRNMINLELKEAVEKQGGKLYFCDFSKKADIDYASRAVVEDQIIWDLFISAVGIMEPITEFAAASMDQWEKNIYVNAVSQMRFLHSILNNRRKGNAAVYFMTSKGVNDTFPKHSAYCVSKIMIIKMCELLDDEIIDCRFIAFNPGYIQTKIIDQEPGIYVSNGQDTADKDYNKKELNKVWNFINWSYEMDKEIVSGRNYFVKYDNWEDKEFLSFLEKSEDTFKLRRENDKWRNRKELL